MPETVNLQYLEWQALVILYRQKDKVSSPLRYVGFKTTIVALMKHHPPLATWVGKSSDNQVHITAAGIALYEGSEYSAPK